VIANALHDLLNEKTVPLQEAICRHFSDDYRQRTDGHWDDRAGFAQHIAHLREVVERADVRVVDEFIRGHSYADRHVVTIVKTDGSRVVQEVYLFGELAPDGRFSRIEEVTLMLAGAESDRDIGSAR
jgi:hypothetical protein